MASPSAHGQAMISTATAAVNAAAVPSPVTIQKPSVASGSGDDDRDEHRRDPVGEALHGGLAVLRLDDEPCDLRQLRVGADAGRPHDEPPAGVDRGAGHRIAGAHLDGNALTGEQRGVDRRRSLLDDAVGRDLLTGADDEPVADDQLVDRDQLLTAAAQHATSLAPSSSSAFSAAPDRRFARASKYRPARMNVVTAAATSR